MVPFTFRQLEVFLCVIDAGNFRRAAEEMSISEVSVGEHIKSLERQLGTTLFYRKRGNTAVLTGVGEQIHEHAKKLMEATSSLLDVVSAKPRGRSRRTVRIGADSYVAHELSKRLASFASAHPDLNIELQSLSFRAAVSGLQDGDLDLGYFMSRGPIPNLDTSHVWNEEIAFYASLDHPLSQKDIVTSQDLTASAFAYVPSRNHIRSLVDSLLSELGISGCPAALTCDDHMTALEVVAQGKGFACMYIRPIAHLLESHRLKPLPFERPIPPFQVRCAARQAYNADPLIRMLIDAMRPNDERATPIKAVEHRMTPAG